MSDRGGASSPTWSSSSSKGSNRATSIIEKMVVQMRRSGSRRAQRRRGKAEEAARWGGGGEAAAKKRVVVAEGKIGLAWEGGVPLMLAAGEYELAAAAEVEVAAEVSEETELVRHGNLHRVRIKGGGHLGVVWAEGLDGGGPKILESGRVEVFASSPSRFRLLTTTEEMVALPDFALGPFRVVTIPTAHVGVAFAYRIPRLLAPGRHYLMMSKLEVFAGTESLLKRESSVNAIIATSKDDMEVIGDLHVEWQIQPEDVAKARLANVMNVEDVVCEKARRAFCLALWEINAQEMQHDIAKESGVLQCVNVTSKRQHSLECISSKVFAECMELFEEDWKIILWGLQVNNIVVLPKTQRKEDSA